MRAATLLGFAAALGFTLAASAAEFRSRIPILTPGKLPPGARAVSEVEPVLRSLVEGAIEKLFADFGANPAAFEANLADDFVNKSRLLDRVTTDLPRDAKLSVLGIASVQTLNQYIQADPATGAEVRVSTVSATVRSQLLFNDPEAGFRRVQGTGDYLIRVFETLE